MGRVARYKKVKSFDPFSKEARKSGRPRMGGGDGSVLWGTTPDDRRAKRRSKTATAMRERKLKKRAGRRGKKGAADDDGGGFDLPPDEDDFDLADVVGSVRSEKRRRLDDGLVDPNERPRKGVVPGAATAAGPKATVPRTEREEREMRRLLGVSGRGAPPSSSSAAAAAENGGGGGRGGTEDEKAAAAAIAGVRGIQPGESLWAFNRRVDEETKIMLKNEEHGAGRGGKGRAVNPERAERKREFLRQKKLKKKAGRIRHLEEQRGLTRDGRGDDDDDDEGGGGGIVTGERAVVAASASALHDTADRPPEFRLLPRGAERKKVVIPSALAGKGKDPDVGGGARKKGGRGMDEAKIAAEQRAMEAMRRRVQEQYRLMKAKRKRTGEGFHL